MSEIIEPLSADRVYWMAEEFAKRACSKSDGYFAQCFDAQERGETIVLVSRNGEKLLGFLKVVWSQTYEPFRDQGIPEIQDLNVVSEAKPSPHQWAI